ncbi:MAG TPA: helix-turn-helix domain-containing protein [Thermoleophilaceae bacterium]
MRVLVADEDLGLRLTPVRVDTLTLDRAAEISAERGLIVRFRRASTDAKAALRARRIHYASDDGEIFVLDPPVAIQQSAPRRARAPADRAASGYDPFAMKASRVSRWLLIHHEDVFTGRELARHTGLSEGAVSNIVRELHARVLVEVRPSPADARVRYVSLPEPGRLLAAWERVWELRRVRLTDWDVGTTSTEDTLGVVRQASSPGLSWAVGGVAGAGLVSRAVEAADVLVWIDPDQLSTWEDLLVPAPGRGSRGTLRLASAPDPFLFELAQDRDDLRVADPAQLYLDCSREGERALEAADAVRRHMGW